MSRKIIKLIIINLFLLVIPFAVLADNTVEINNIENTNITGDSEEIEKPVIDGLNITFNNKFHNVGDSISYRIKVDNTTNLDYKISIEGPNSDYIDYTYTFLNNNEILSKNTSDYIDITITYKNKIKEDNYKESNKIVIKLVNEDEAENPKTGINKPIIFILLIILGIVLYILIRNKHMIKHINIILLGLLILLPITIYALNIYTINIISNIEIEKEKYIVTFDPNGGSVDPTEKEVVYLEPYDML